MLRRRVEWSSVVYLVAIVAFGAVLLRRALFGGGALLGFDLFAYFFPTKVFAAEALLRGELPLWNPYIFFGAPFLANIQMGVLYPLNLLYLFLSFPTATAASQALHLALGGAGMYALCRWGWGLDAAASLAGALAFAGSGFFGAHVGHLNQVHAGVWLPWIALAQWSLARRLGERRWRAAAVWLVAGGAFVALQITAGHTQEAYYTHLALGLLALGFTLFPPARAPRRWTHLPALVAVDLNGALLAAAQLVPTLELSRLSYRQGGMSLAESVAFGVERTNILETVLPTFWSLPSQEVTGYVGVAALVCAAIALGASPARRQVLALALLALLALTLALGAYTPLYGLLHEWVPLFGSFRAPGRWLLVSTFALAGLAAHGADALRFRHTPALRERALLGLGRALLVGTAALLFVVWRTNEVHAIQWLPHARVAVLWGIAGLGAIALGALAPFSLWGWPRMLLAAGMALELAFAAREMEYNRPGDPALYRQAPAVAGYLAAGAAQGRSAATDRMVSLAVEERLPADRLLRALPAGDGEYRRYAAMKETLRPNLSMVFGLPTVDGYDGGLLPLRDYALFKSLLVPQEPVVAHFTLALQASGRAEAALYGALGVRYLLADGRHGPPGPGWEERAAPGASLVYENARTGPRAFVAATVEVAPDQRGALRRLAGVDPGRTAVVEVAPGQPPVAASADGGGDARVVRYAAQEVEIEVESASGGLLVLTDTFYPGWRAAVDGQDAPVYRANVLFRGVPVPAGSHRVRLWYDPLSVKIGFAASGVALLLNVVLAALGARRRPTRRRRPAA